MIWPFLLKRCAGASEQDTIDFQLFGAKYQND